ACQTKHALAAGCSRSVTVSVKALRAEPDAGGDVGQDGNLSNVFYAGTSATCDGAHGRAPACAAENVDKFSGFPPTIIAHTTADPPTTITSNNHFSAGTTNIN